MPLARIITSQQHGTDEDELKQQLQAAGYEVEVVAGGLASSRAADLQVELETVSAAQALDAALRMARDGADVFVAPGLVTPLAAPAPPVVAKPSAVLSQPMPQRPVAELQTEAESSGAEDEARGPSLFQRVGIAWAERQRRAEERRVERECHLREEGERRWEEALELQRRREQDERARAERLRQEREQMAREAVLRAERARQIEEGERRRAAEVPRQAFRPVQPPDPQRLAAMEAQMKAAPAAPKTVASPKPTVTAAALDATLTASPRPMARQAGTRPVARPARRIPSPRQRRWQRATLLASLVALMAMLGFAIAMNLRPVAPLPSNMLQNNAQQQVPFGPATITPAPAARPAASSARTTAVSTTRKPAPRPSAAREKPVHAAPRARSGSQSPADNEILVRHYSSASSAHAQSPGIRRYSDQ